LNDGCVAESLRERRRELCKELFIALRAFSFILGRGGDMPQYVAVKHSC
jgi:hypothetical protein